MKSQEEVDLSVLEMFKNRYKACKNFRERYVVIGEARENLTYDSMMKFFDFAIAWFDLILEIPEES